MKKVFLGLGSNLGKRKKNLKEALIRIGESAGTVVSASSLYETEPWGFKSDTEFLNMVICIETDLTPSGLMGRILMIESQLGRLRCEDKYASRKIDIDILLYNNEIVNEAALTIPHPHIHERRFVLVPMAELVPELIHPVLKKTIASLLKSCEDYSKVRKYKETDSAPLVFPLKGSSDPP
ncbi:MAG: 2-amino-4-hydroxy-6-hydroxymethyldihydropteridine diphosphokinase [Odoribacter sp.]|nr:2-amino-4-hydroxy-6-hydroxymethyldihydropteridine diphosphokinase [Odoribacter sp.]